MKAPLVTSQGKFQSARALSTFQPDGTIVIRNIPTVAAPVPVVNMMMNLGHLIKAKEVSALGAAIFAKHGLKSPAR